MKPQRNDPCTCGSGKKYKKCCGITAAPREELFSTPYFEPTSVEITHLLSLLNANRHDELEKLTHSLLKVYPNSGFIWKVLGASLRFQRKNPIDAFIKSVELLPNDAEAHSNLGAALSDAGQFDAAIASFRSALALNPKHAEAYNNLGAALSELGQTDEAIFNFHQAIRLTPNYTLAISNLGSALKKQGNLNDAILSYRQAIDIDATLVPAIYNLGNALAETHQYEEAKEYLIKAISISPDDADLYNSLANILQQTNNLDDALLYYQKALSINPKLVEAHNNLGSALRTIGQASEAIISFQNALDLCPSSLEIRNNIADTFYLLGNKKETFKQLKSILETHPTFDIALNNLGLTLLDFGEIEGAIQQFRKGIKINPNFSKCHSNLLFSLSHSIDINETELFNEHILYSQQFEQCFVDSWPIHQNIRNSEKQIKIGIVSGDLCNHAVLNFIEPILKQTSKNSNFSLHAYYNRHIEDDGSRRVRSFFNKWTNISTIDDDQLFKEISAEKIDILIDLSGHTGLNRLTVFARKPAPIQVSWLGYPGTTGLKSIDYFLADEYQLPPGKFDSQFTEKIIYLPVNTPFTPHELALPPNSLPALKNGYVTFGSFNRLNKLNLSIVATWSELLRELPDSKIVIGNMPDANELDMLFEWFAQEGIERERITICNRTSMGNYLELHHTVDICLNTFPYTGGTTICHALWMGVPTLTLVGNTVPSRGGASILGHLSLHSFIASDRKEFLQKGLYWAKHLTELADLRLGLRDQFSQSKLSQATLAARGFEAAMRRIWKMWCTKLPPASLKVSISELI